MADKYPVHRDLRYGLHGNDVRALQREVNQRLRVREQTEYLVAVDGAYGPQTRRACSRALFLLGVPLRSCEAGRSGVVDKEQQTRLRHPATRSKRAVALAAKRWAVEKKRLAAVPLRLKAHAEMVKLIGVMEQGGNNMGPMVMTIIRANGGPGPEPWCGDTQAYVYRKAGSQAVDRSWASVELTGHDPDVHPISHPETGDLVRFRFDHIGMFECDNGNGTITTLEGNTGPSGAVSDSSTGGDGVYRKVRSKSLVRDYLRVER